MADYYAVLSRTLAGFGEPKPELRGKLYARARMTIRRQLDSHTPPLDATALKAEMDKLEEAIKKVESGFGPPNVSLQETQPDAEPAEPAPKDIAVETEIPKVDEAKEREKSEQASPPKKPESAPQPQAETPLSRREKRAAAKAEAKRKKPEKAAGDKADKGKAEAETKTARKEVATKTERVEETKPEKPDDTLGPKKEPAPDPATSEATSETDGEVVDPMDEWAREFLNAQEESKPEVAQALAEIHAETAKSPKQADVIKPDPDERAATIAAAATAAAASKSATAKAPELPAFEANQDKSIVIPPAPSSGADSGKGGILKWLLLALLALLIAAIGYLAVNWEDRAEIAARLGMDGLFGGTVQPRPVKTIKIIPDPEPEPKPDPQPAPETQAPSTPDPETPKSEDRLTSDSGVEQPATPAPDAPAAVDGQTTSATGSEDNAAAQPETGTGQTAETLPAAEAGASPVVAQSAILYEEGGSPSDSSFDTGRVVWSVVEEQGGEGEGNIPAIRARVEVPSRQLVLIMTVKRNTDRALPASHLIELVFAVPDDFSGGSIGEISTLR